jgi:uncharacterized protein (DUF3084 family)
VVIEQSTSAQLRATQGALAASQADLTRALAERDRFIKAADELHGSWLDLKADIARLKLERDGVREELTRQAASNEDLTATLAMRTGQLRTARQERDEALHELEHATFKHGMDKTRLHHARAELASARQELALLRATQVPHSHTDVPHTQETS